MTKEEEEYVKLKDTGIVRLGTSAISALYAQEEIQTALRTEEKYLCSLIKGGAEGISIDSILKIPDSDGVVDIVITYEADNPFLPGDIGDFDMIQRCYVKAWLGFDYKDEAEPDTTVYVTETGEVYHLSRECTYLKAKVLLAAYNMGLVKMGNKEYSPCQICMSDKWAENMSVFVYITEHGTKYHKDDSCSTLKRTVYEISLEEAVEKYDLCQRCEKEGKR
ncbi:MAG: hypothetical protein IJW18_08955 [Lachnospiraceae bacterium]|nr:hypothetical protein [Lachnospiraceae bacterium]